MITLINKHRIIPFAEAKKAMASCIEQLPAQLSNIDPSQKMIRVELSIQPVEILYWLHNQKTDTKIYWSDREGHFEMGGIGIADRLMGESSIDHGSCFSYMQDCLSSDHPCLRYYGGISFDASCKDPEWRKFGSYQFMIPQFELCSSNSRMYFAFNIKRDDMNKESLKHALDQLDQIDFSLKTTYRKPPKVLKRNDFPNKSTWNSLFCDIGIDINESKYEKIVLARRSIFDFDIPIRSVALMKHLKDRTPDCFHFCFQVTENTAFLGATPERLFKREKKNVWTEAIAGTRPRGEDSRHDKALEKQLLRSSKDAHEHRYVVDMIHREMKSFCRRINSDKTFSLRKLKGSQHLKTSFEGNLKDPFSDSDILAALHPTPAVAGTPTEVAMKVIREKEPFGRGWYAGPVGYVGFDRSEFAVAIRSGLINAHQLSLYAGAGIVAGSTANDEWNEIENKISNFIEVFNI